MSSPAPNAKKKKKGIITPVFRMSFPHVFQVWKGDASDDDAYSVHIYCAVIHERVLIFGGG